MISIVTVYCGNCVYCGYLTQASIADTGYLRILSIADTQNCGYSQKRWYPPVLRWILSIHASPGSSPRRSSPRRSSPRRSSPRRSSPLRCPRRESMPPAKAPLRQSQLVFAGCLRQIVVSDWETCCIAARRKYAGSSAQ